AAGQFLLCPPRTDFHACGAAPRARGHLGSGLARSIASQTSLAESPSLPFAFVAELFTCGPPVGGTFWFQIFIQAPSPEIWRKTISGGEEVLAGKWGGLFLGYFLGRNYRRRDRDQLSFRSGAREASGSETARVHRVARRRCV